MSLGIKRLISYFPICIPTYIIILFTILPLLAYLQPTRDFCFFVYMYRYITYINNASAHTEAW